MVPHLQKSMDFSQGKAFTLQAISLLVAIGGTWAVLYYLGSALSSTDLIGGEYEKEIERLFCVEVKLFRPEPLERLRFLSGLLLFPLLVLGSQIALFSMAKRLLLEEEGWDRLQSALWTLFALGVAVLIINIPFHAYLSPPRPMHLAVFAACLWAVYSLDGRYGGARREYAGRVFDGLAFFLIIFVPMLVIFDLRDVTYEGRFSSHFQSVFFPVVQVYFGKALLVDFNGQYGLYAHFLEPLFRLVGLSILSFTAVMAFMLGSSFFFVFLFLRKVIVNRVLALLGFLAVLYLGYILSANVPPYIDNDPYFQYFPIRYFFPTLFVLLSWRYLTGGGEVLYWISFPVYSLAFLWNGDTGVVVLVGWVLVLVYKSWYDHAPGPALRQSLKHLLNGLWIPGATVFLFCSYLRLRYGVWPDLKQFFTYQQIYYQYGLYMLPMPMWHPWNILVLTYMGGLSYSIRCLLLKGKGMTGKIVFMLSILGSGLFVYYQGRSHVLCLKPVIYPAVMLWAVFADRLYLSISRTKVLRRAWGKAFFLGCLMWMFSLPVTGLARDLLKHPVGKEGFCSFFSDRRGIPGLVETNAMFFQTHVEPGDKVLILSRLSALYYLAALTPDASGVGDHTVMVLRKDLNRLKAFIESGRGCDKIFVDLRLPMIYLTIPLESMIINRYDLVAKSRQEVYYFRKKAGKAA